MTREEFRRLIEQKIIVLDGSTGIMLQRAGMPKGVCPELWTVENPEIILKIQREYVEAGSDIIYTATFGGTPLKLDEYGLKDRTEELNKRIALLAKEAAADKAYVAGDLAPTGMFIKPNGPMEFEEIVDAYKAQVKGLLQGGVDLFVIETMMDLQEARAALLAVKELSDLPVIVTMTFEESGRTLTGTDPITAINVLQSMGADAVGCNCSTGPKEMLKIVEQMKEYAKIPVVAKPNAGLPKLINGETVFSMDADEFAAYMDEYAKAGVNLFGGCCGTTPQFIKMCKEKLIAYKPSRINPIEKSLLSSALKTVEIGSHLPLSIIGERINPTGKKALKEELKEG